MGARRPSPPRSGLPWRRPPASSATSLSPAQAEVLVALIDEFRRDDFLRRVRDVDLPAIKILADVINGWDPDGVYEFARAWTSTLVAREDDFQWSNCDAEAKEEHHRRVEAEMARRGLAHHGT